MLLMRPWDQLGLENPPQWWPLGSGVLTNGLLVIIHVYRPMYRKLDIQKRRGAYAASSGNVSPSLAEGLSPNFTCSWRRLHLSMEIQLIYEGILKWVEGVLRGLDSLATKFCGIGTQAVLSDRQQKTRETFPFLNIQSQKVVHRVWKWMFQESS